MNAFAKIVSAACFVAALTTSAFAVESPAGTWQSVDGTTRFEVTLCGDGADVCAKLVYLGGAAATPENMQYLNQYVLLGAGFDSIALRRPAWLRGVKIIEVDHPATQAVKLARMAAGGAHLPLTDFEAVPVDFEREHLGDGLARSSFEPGQKSFFCVAGRDLLPDCPRHCRHPAPYRCRQCAG